MATAGANTGQGLVSMSERPSAAIVPQSGVGGGGPSPIKLRPAVTRIAMPNRIDTSTMMVG